MTMSNSRAAPLALRSTETEINQPDKAEKTTGRKAKGYNNAESASDDRWHHRKTQFVISLRTTNCAHHFSSMQENTSTGSNVASAVTINTATMLEQNSPGVYDEKLLATNDCLKSPKCLISFY